MQTINADKLINTAFFILFIILNATAYAAEINIQLNQQSINNKVIVSLTNRSNQELTLAKIRLQLDRKTYWLHNQDILQAGESKRYNFTISYPQAFGSYAQITSVFYYNEGRLFSLSDVGYFNYKSVKHFDVDAKLASGKTTKQSFLYLTAKNPQLWTIIVPDEVSITTVNLAKSRRFLLSGNYSGFNSNYPVFAIREGLVQGVHFAKILHSVVSVKHANSTTHVTYSRGRTSNLLLSGFCIVSLSLFVLFRKKTITLPYLSSTVWLLFSSRLLLLSVSFLLLKNAHDWLSFSSLLGKHFAGNNFRYFFLYFIDAYFWSFVILYLPYLYFIDKPSDVTGDINKDKGTTNIKYFVDEDKYVAVLLWILRPFKFLAIGSTKHFKTSKQQLQSPLKTGWLLLAVKFFFLPLLASWVIGNIIHQWNLIQHFSWTFHQINAFILALLILVDTSIFLFGYMFESTRLKSRVRSVEPTLLGWIVCLWCYPPFNSFSFAAFDIDFVSIHIPVATWAEPIVLVSISLCWLIFVWASIALGFKASNLTNRGIVSSGPYRFCRHPAYTAKIAVWLIEAVFLGKYFIGLFLGFLIIYLLRSLTEERHLSMDADYQRYKKKVPYRFIPGII